MSVLLSTLTQHDALIDMMSAVFVLPQPFQPMGTGKEEAEGNILFLRESAKTCILQLSLMSHGLECSHVTIPDYKGSWRVWLDCHSPS